MHVTFMANELNSDYFQTAMSFIEFAKEAKSNEALSAAFLQKIQYFGFEGYACVSFCDFSAAPDNAVLLMEYPEEWMDRYLEQKYERFDKVLSTNLSQTLPFSWDEKAILRNITEQQTKIFEEARSVGILYGFSVPIHAHGYLPASVNLIGPHTDVDPAIKHAVHLMSIYLHDAALRFSSQQKSVIRPSVNATERERECLQWVAEGKSDSVIADLLGVSKRTVHFHIENIKRKYGVATRIQAVVRAYLENLIIPQ